MAKNNVIFIHPDGTSPSHFAAGRFVKEGPDGRLNWDNMTEAGVYLGHIKDRLVSTSNAGAVVHAYGTKPFAGSYGLDENGNPVESLSFKSGAANESGLTIMEEAIAAGKATAVINSGFIAEPGTGVFLADAESRNDVAEITAEIVESGVNIILGGGEIHYLPEGTVGRFGEEGIRTDGRNLIEEAKELGYTVVFTREELQNLPQGTNKVLGIFAAEDTYNDTTEEANAAQGLENYGQPGNENPPTVGEMLETALPILDQDPDGFYVVLEEEGSDNFPNNNNARGAIEAVLRADEAIGVAQDFIDKTDPNTLLITAADSDAGGLEVDDTEPEQVGTVGVNPTLDDRSDAIEVPRDGQSGRNTEPFVSAPNAFGKELPFGVSYVGTPDFAGSIVAKTYGLNSEELPSTLDNTDIYRLMYKTLFEKELPQAVPAPPPQRAPQATKDTGNVIFIHPDGTSPSHYAAGRFAKEGPDGRLNWDKMSDAGVYLGHIKDRLVSTSNAGAVVHAFGVKPQAGSYGLDEEGNPVTSLSGKEGKTIMEEAIDAGKAVAVINSGFIAEPGTGVFLSDVENRSNVAEITEEILFSGANVILGGGEIHYLPEGTVGKFGEEGIRTDGRNLIEEAKELGYTVVFTREELQNLPKGTGKVLGIFAAEDTYNDTTEEANAAQGLDSYGQPGNENPPTVAEMLEAALPIVSQDPDGFFVVLEEEGSDNFPNNNNARGTIEAVLRADEAIGVAMDYIEKNDPNTLLLTAADSDGGGLEVDDTDPEQVGTIGVNPTEADRSDAIEVPLDGQNGRNTEPFVSAPNAFGEELPFGVSYVGTPDFAGSIVAKTYGLNAQELPSTLDNTDIYRLMYQTLFEKELHQAVEAPAPKRAPEATKDTGNVIFIHPDGTSPSHYAAGRFVQEGPDGRLNWDKMSDAGVYLGHIKDRLVSTSNAGAVVHAFGVKPQADSYGLDEEGNPVTSLSGKEGTTIMEEAIDAGKAVAVINSGFIAEPGTGVFLSDAEDRSNVAEITAEILFSGANVILGGGEIHYLPEGTIGRFGEEGIRTDGRNLIEEAKELGYTVVFTREELQNLPKGTSKVLGIFAAEDTYNDTTEEANAAEGLDNYGQPGNENPPTVAEMLAAALPILDKDPDGFFVVLEEEGSDNFANNNNSRGAIEAVLRADEAIGVAMDYIENHDPNTLLLTAADSDAGGLEVDDTEPELVGTVEVNPTQDDRSDAIEVPLDGQNGRNTEPFISAPNADGEKFPFGIGYTGTPDVAGSIVTKAHGLNADLLPSTADNTDMYRLMYRTLFGVAPEEVAGEETGYLIGGTPGNDLLIPGLKSDFDGKDDILFTGAGNDEVDLQGATSSNLGNNRIDLGSGDDIISVSKNDIVFGGAGNDVFDATNAMGGNYISGGDGDDIFFLGKQDRVLGGDGVDKFFVQSGGDNLIGGGEGADQFWIVSGELPENANTVLDFEVGTDVIGILGSESLGISADTLELKEVDGNTNIFFNNQKLAGINGVTGLDDSSFVFA